MKFIACLSLRGDHFLLLPLLSFLSVAFVLDKNIYLLLKLKGTATKVERVKILKLKLLRESDSDIRV